MSDHLCACGNPHCLAYRYVRHDKRPLARRLNRIVLLLLHLPERFDVTSEAFSLLRLRTSLRDGSYA